jgi:hypothetical protein
MIFSRILYLLFALVAVFFVAAAMLAQGVINRERVSDLDSGLRRDRFGLESLLKLDARARLDTLAPIAADGTIREAVRKPDGKVEGQDAPKALKERLRTLNQQLEELRADLLIAVDANGMIVAQEGRKPPREGAGLGKVPVVERALAGYLGDDVWVYDGAVYRVAARPIVDRGMYAGALIHCQRLDAVLAQRLSERLGGATIAFFFGQDVVASYTPTDVVGAPTQNELTTPLASALADPRLKEGGASEAIDIDGRARAVYSLIAGSASSANVGYAIGRPYRLVEKPWNVFDETTKEDVAQLPRLWLVLGLLLGVLVAMLALFIEHDRHLVAFRRMATQLSKGEITELDVAALGGRYRKVAASINDALDVVVEKSGGKRRASKANLDEILGPAPETLTSAAFSFGADAEVPAAAVQVPAPMPAPVAMPAPGARPPAPAIPKVPPPRVPPAPSKPENEAGGANSGEKSVMLRLDGSSDGEDERTLVAEVPDSLRNPTRDDETHFREVFEQYVALRKQCGEATADLTYEKFAVTLRKNRDQIVLARPDTQEVRFTVYVKAGKAALKASPVKA